MRLGRALAWAGVLGLSLGCVTLPEFRHLEREVAELKRQSGGGGGGRVGERLADLGAEVESLAGEVARLRGEVEEARHAADRALTEAAGAAARSVVRAPTGAATATSPSGATPAAGGAGGGAVVAPAPLNATTSGEKPEYEAAFRLYRSGEYSTAVDRFQTFLQTHASSDYADNALFWMGECYFKLGDHERAVLTFAEVVELYPDGNKVPDALYRQGRAMLALGESSGQPENYTPAARQVFERIVVEHPDSERVGEAQRQLEKLGP